jgi:hypothetical protein
MSPEIPAEWGVVYDGHTLRLSITPSATPMLLERARFGRTVADLRAKTRPDRVVVQVGIRFGPPIPIQIELTKGEVWQVLVDENAIDGATAAFVASHEHEVQFLMTHDS